jgi:outer membrane receptor protein involved in Fe transport
VQDVPANEQGLSLVFSAPPLYGLGAHRLLGGADLHRVEGVSTETTPGGTRTSGGQQQLGGVFLQELWSPASIVEVSGALRFDGWRNTSGRLEDPSSGLTRYPDRLDGAVSPRLGLRVRPVDFLTFRASGYRAFRAPTLNELYRPFQVGTVLTQANPALAPETLWGAEVGAQVDARVFSASLTGFANDWRSPIVNVTLPGGMRQRQNLGSARVRGLEAAVGFAPVRQLRLQLAYTLVDSQVTSAPGADNLVGHRLPQDPVHRGFASVTFDDERLFSATVQMRWIGPQYEDDLNTLPMAGYVVFDARVSRRLYGPLQLFVAVENMFDRPYLAGRAGVDTLGAPLTLRAGLSLHRDEL